MLFKRGVAEPNPVGVWSVGVRDDPNPPGLSSIGVLNEPFSKRVGVLRKGGMAEPIPREVARELAELALALAGPNPLYVAWEPT